MEDMMFKDLGLSDKMLLALEKKGYGYPTTIQQQAIPEFLQWRELQGQEQLLWERKRHLQQPLPLLLHIRHRLR